MTRDRNGRRKDVFAWDRTTGRTVLVSRGRGSRGADEPSFDPVVSADGRYVAYASAATNLVRHDGNRRTDVFVWDSVSERTTIVSHARGHRQRTGTGWAQDPWITADGGTVVFRTRNGFFEHRVSDGRIRRIVEPRRNTTWPGWIASPDGRYVAVRPSPSSYSLRVWDRWENQIWGRCFVGFRPTGSGVLSADGRFFTGSVSEFRRDLVGEFTGSCDLDGVGDPPFTVISATVAATTDGQTVAANLQVPEGGSVLMDVRLTDRMGAGESAFIDRPVSSWAGATDRPGVSVSADGRVVAYDAESGTLIAGPGQSFRAIYVWIRNPA